MPTLYPATPKQLSFLTRLAVERGMDLNTQGLTTRDASEFITRLLAYKPVATASSSAAAPVTEVGMYRDPAGALFKVQASKESKNLYAKALTPITGKRLTEEDEIVGWEFTYAPGAVRSLTPAMRLTLEEAKAFGIRYGVCCVCGATLKDATSVANGIGPICATRI
jgi:hypothetical protein